MNMSISGVNTGSIKNAYNNAKSITNDIFKIESTTEKDKKEADIVEQKEQYNKEDLDKAINKINKFLEDEKTHAEYSVHKDLGTMMIKIVEDDTKDVILEVPPEKILDMVASMCKSFGLLDKTV